MILLRKASLIGWGPRGYSGATCTLALCARGLLHTANIGDSRMGNGDDAQLMLTNLHRFGNNLEQGFFTAHFSVLDRFTFQYDQIF